MKIRNKTRNKIVRNIELSSNALTDNLKIILENVKKAESVEKLMEYKKAILISWLDLIPLAVDHCYFCQLYWPNCVSCEYGKIHGICKNNINSDYLKISDALNMLKGKINYYYNKDIYTPQIKRVTVKCKCGMKYRRKINDENNYGCCNKCGEILS